MQRRDAPLWQPHLGLLRTAKRGSWQPSQGWPTDFVDTQTGCGQTKAAVLKGTTDQLEIHRLLPEKAAEKWIAYRYLFRLHGDFDPTHSGCSTSLPWPFIDVSGVKHGRTLPITAFHSLKSLVASTYDPPDANNWMYHASAVLSGRTFASAGPTVWNSLPDNLRNWLSDRTSFNEN